MLIGDCNVCINGKLPSYNATCVECGLSRKNYKPITNADRIRTMTDEELSIALCLGGCPPTAWDEYGVLDCPKPNEEVCEEVCGSCWLDWLKQEAK